MEDKEKMTRKQLIHLPLSLLQEIYQFIVGSYLTTQYHIENNAKIWRNIMNVNREAFQEYRKLTIIYSLNKYHTLLFLRSEDFRQKVCSRIHDRHRQLGFVIKQHETILEEDMELLNPCFHVIIRAEQIRNLSWIKNVKLVEIFDCPKVSDVSALGTVETLILFNCNGIRDITGLGTVKKLSLYNCNNIEKGFQSLQHVIMLNINHSRLESTLGMENVQELLLTCNRLKEIPLPLLAKKVSIHSSNFITDVGNLSNVLDVSFTHCNALQSVNSLTSTKKLSISSCSISASIDLLQLKVLHTLSISFCNIQLLVIPQESQLEKLSVSLCANLSKITIHKPMEEVEVVGCKRLEEISSSNGIGSLEVHYHPASGPQMKIKGGVEKLLFAPWN